MDKDTFLGILSIVGLVLGALVPVIFGKDGWLPKLLIRPFPAHRLYRKGGDIDIQMTGEFMETLRAENVALRQSMAFAWTTINDLRVELDEERRKRQALENKVEELQNKLDRRDRSPDDRTRKDDNG